MNLEGKEQEPPGEKDEWILLLMVFKMESDFLVISVVTSAAGGVCETSSPELLVMEALPSAMLSVDMVTLVGCERTIIR